MKKRQSIMVLRLLELLLTLPLLATCAAEEPISEPASKQVFFGDLHLHTRYSNDAFYLTTEEGLDEAYNYAKGEAVTRTNGDSVKLNTPLDFLAVTEHAEFLGAAQSFVDPSHPLYDHPTLGRLLRSPESDERMKAWFAFEKGAKAGGAFDGYDEEALKQAVWTAIVDAADRHNNPGTFTTFAAYEWTAYIEGGNMHRNVIFNDTKDLSVPFTARESNRPEDLWTFLERMRSTGIEALAIPHNPNVSDGRMFTALDSDGGPIDAAYAARRTRNEPLVEITQNKGTSETHPELSPDDAFADHEIWPLLITGHNKVGKVEGSYVRDALLLGINEKRLRGFNPLMFGFVGATDSHSGLSNIEEDNSPGFGGSLYDSTPESRWNRQAWNGLPYWAFSVSGVTGVWAEENTRDQIFEALARREAYATTGSRIRVRVFADWGGSKAVPMGGVLAGKASGEAPTLTAWAAKDPKGAGLERVQIIKGWTDGNGARAKIFDVAVTDHASEAGDQGAEKLEAKWTDPDFNPAFPAFYYVRVIEVPTRRWSTYDAEALNETLPADMPALIQERAFTSPIWYEP